MPALKAQKLSLPAKIFVIAAVALIYCPFFSMNMIGQGYIGDSLIQIRIGLDMISSRGLILNDIYSWHEGLNWYAHEEGWYFVAGLAYKLAGIAGVIGLTAVFNYAIAGIIYKHELKTVDPYIMLLTSAAGVFLTFPNYNARPHLVSQLIITVFVYAMMSGKLSSVRKCILFAVSAFIMSWFHGGMIPLFFVIFALFIVIEALFRQFKTCAVYLAGMVCGFAASLLNPIGIGVWTFGLKQTGASDIWQFVEEWNPKTFSIPEITLILAFLLGFAVDERLRRFDKNTLIRFALICMFIIASCRYCRFMNYTALFIVMFGGEELQILLNWINDNITKFDKSSFELHDISYYILTVFCAGFMLFTVITSWLSYFPTNTVSDISALAAYDEGVISVLKEKDYDRIYNSFNTGTWLAFYGIPVHIDNRIDPYLEEYSGEDHIRGQMLINTIGDMDAFVDRYDADAVVLDLMPGTTDEYFADELYASDRYNVIYDNTVVSNYDGEISFRWLIAECVR